MSDNGNTSVSQSSAASGGKQILRIPVVTAGVISAIASLFLFIGGWTSGYITFRSEMSAIALRLVEFQIANGKLQDHMDAINRSISDDRQNLTARITSLEAEAKFISQGVAELKLAIVPKR